MPPEETSPNPLPGKELDGLGVVVTGAGQGIGRSVAASLATLGASVVVNDVNATNADSTSAEIIASGGVAVSHQADVSSYEEAAGLIKRCVDEFGSVDGLVNNAALMSNGTIEEYDPEEFRRVLSVNVLGLANCATSALTVMLARGSGSVVNITSGAHLGMQHMGLYGASKGAVASLTYTWALETAGRGVRVNAVSPWASSGMSQVTDAYRTERGLSALDVGFPHPDSNAPVVAYLVSEASRDVTGQIFRIQGTVLSLMAHPSVMPPLLERSQWDVASIGVAVDETFRPRFAPVGIAYGEPASSAAPQIISYR